MEKMHSDDERGKFDLAALVVSKREREREREREEDKERRRGDILKLSLCGGYYQ
jgi:type II secretory pathway component PulK